VRVPTLFVASLIVLSAWAPSASAGVVGGGRYVGDVSFGADRCRNCVRLVVANDGGELQRYSTVDLTRRWRRGMSCDVSLSFYSFDPGDRDRVPIAVDGSFSRSIRYFPRLSVRLAGQFSSDRRRVRGTLRVRGRRPGCKMHATLRLRARLVGRPRAPVAGRWSRCDPYFAGESRWDVFDLDVGCTAARAAARAWLTDPSCRNLVEGTSCVAGALQCGPVARGERAPPDQVRCAPPDVTGPAVELLQTQQCGYDGGIETYTTNVPCTEALAVLDAYFWEDNADCLDDTCTVRGYSCRLEDGTDTSFIHRCRAGDRAVIEFNVYG
jgi:hypothetical protein